MSLLRKNLLWPLCAALLLLCASSHAQLPAPPATTEDALHQMLSQAGVAFTGQVAAVRRIASANGFTGLIEVDFSIDDAILGVAPNTIYTLRQWTGLAPNSDSSFQIGRRYLMFLHTPGPGGLSSPVGGPDGAIPILPGNEAASPTTPDALGLAAQPALNQPASLTNTNTAPTISPSPAHTTFRLGSGVDSEVSQLPSTLPAPAVPAPLASSTINLRWIAARVVAPVTYAPDTVPPIEAHPIVARANAILPTMTEAATSASQPPTSSANYSSLLALLHSWHEEDHASR
jgi:hypothetical protein